MEIVDASSVLSGLSNKLLDRFRMYLAVVRDLDYNLTEEIQKVCRGFNFTLDYANATPVEFIYRRNY